MVPSFLDFGAVQAGTGSEPQAVTVDNGTGDPFTITALSIVGEDPDAFEISSVLPLPLTLLPGEAATVEIRFLPPQTGPYGASLRIGGGGGSSAVALSGIGTSLQDLIVTTTADTDDGVCDAHCSLREAVDWANGDSDQSRILFAPDLAGRTIHVSWGMIVIRQPLTIDGQDLGVTISGGGRSSIFMVSRSFGTTTLRDLTITGGVAEEGGGVYCFDGSLTLDRVTVRGNRATDFDGGGISAEYCALTVLNSTISGNTAADDGGGIIIFSDDTAVIENTTISGNTAGDKGGGIFSGDFDLVGGARLRNVTLTDNHAGTDGGGIYNNDGPTPDFYNSIVAGNTAYGYLHAPTADCVSSVIHGHSVVGRGTGCVHTGTDVTVTVDKVFTRVLSPILANNGGPTRTHTLFYRADNPALDIGGTCGPTDQRGFPAPVDGPDLDDTPRCDAGSVEAGPPPPVTLAVAPVAPPIEIPPEGGAFAFTVTLTNPTEEPQAMQAWAEAVQPDGTVLVAPYGPLLGPISIVLGPGEVVERELVQAVPAQAMAGEWTYAGYAGAYPGAGVSSGFLVVKDAARTRVNASARGEGEVRNRRLNGEWSVAYAESGAPVQTGDVWTANRPALASASAGMASPSSFALHEAQPNPFTSRTTLRYDVPEASRVRLVVYDVLGREVAVLLDGSAEAGLHEAVLDASGLAAGVYVARLTAGGLTATRQVVVTR